MHARTNLDAVVLLRRVISDPPNEETRRNRRVLVKDEQKITARVRWVALSSDGESSKRKK
jgi:hypothetical protein